MLSEKARQEIRTLCQQYPSHQSGLLAALYVAQQEYGGWLPPEALDEVATLMGLPATYVASAASFYTMFHRKPVGHHRIEVCTNISCSLLGADHLLAYLSRKLGIQVGETTPDGQFTLLEVECLGSCGTAPVIKIDDQYYENLTEEKVDHILDRITTGKGRAS